MKLYSRRSQDTKQMPRTQSRNDGAVQRRNVFNIPVALSLMVFFALCMERDATLAVIAKELDWGWAVGSFFVLTSIAWVAAVLAYQIGMLFV